MAKKKKVEIDPIEKAMANIVVDSEYRVAAQNNEMENTEFESLVDMLELRRNEKDYDWMSDIFIPEMNSIILTDASSWANQYFQSRDFVDVILTSDQVDKARCAKTCINKTLNDRDLFYFQKHIRRQLIKTLAGKCYVICYWEQETHTEYDKRQRPKVTGYNPENNMPIYGYEDVEIPREVVTKDNFNFDVLDPRNVFTDTTYCYSAQQKDWITIRSEKCYDDLKKKEKANRYVNLDLVKEAVRKQMQETETKKQTYGKDEDKRDIKGTPLKYFDVLDRYGKFWAIVTDRWPDGNPKEIKPGIDAQGMALDDAELVESIITYALIGQEKIQIRFIATDNIDANGLPFKPIIRGLCYVHPTKDEGLSDGKNMREIQIALNDDFNRGRDRTMLATLPTLLGRKDALQDGETFYMEPEHIIECENPETDFKELQIRDNIQGNLQQIAMLTAKMQQVTAIYPTTMGQLPDKASTTATAVAGAENRGNARAGYKSLTDEHTFLVELYSMILNMTHRFMKDKTAWEMMGADAVHFDAKPDYSYMPVSSNIEAEANKFKKIQQYDQSIGRLSGLVKGLPEIIPIIAHMTARQLELLGDEYVKFGHMIDNLTKAKYREEGEQPNQVKDMSAPPTSNQMGMPMSLQEQGTRENAMAQGGMIG